jgi:ribosomal protein S18 acetylase RimI-like enzyme
MEITSGDIQKMKENIRRECILHFMKIVRLTKENEEIFWKFVRNKVAEYFFFIVDLRQYPEYTIIDLVLDDADHIRGMRILWKNRVIQLRGDREAVKLLLDNVSIVPREVTGLPAHQDLIRARFPAIKFGFALVRMFLKQEGWKQKELPQDPSVSVVPLGEHDREEIATLMQIADPKFWGDRKPEDLTFDAANLWYGIKDSGTIVAFCNIWVDDMASIVPIVATHPDYRGRGYATQVVIYGIESIWENSSSSLALIHVRADNAPAVHVYTKVGFKPLVTYEVAHLQKENDKKNT